MEEFVATQIRYGLKYVPANLLKSYFLPKGSAETRALRARGFLRGVCHPNEDYKLLRDAHIQWVRFDVPFPFTPQGEESQDYLAFKERCRGYAGRGFSVMAVTPFPNAFASNGIDPRTPSDEARVREVAEFLARDLQGLVGGFQIANEQGLPKFTLPLTLDEAARFIGIQAEAMYPLRGDVLIGYNSGGPEAKLHALLRPYHRFCDYVGIDIYLGCFAGLPGLMCIFDALLRYLWAMTGKPVLLQEFGYIGGGAPKTKAQKKALLRSYGPEREKDAKRDIEALVEKLPSNFRYSLRFDGKNDPTRYYDLLFHSDYRQHFYKEMPPLTRIPGYPHTPEGQAKFYDDLIPRLYRLPFVAGAMIYCWSDAEACGYCGQSDCPVETRWGLTDCAGRPKPSYYAAQRQFGRIVSREKAERESAEKTV
ncbi:MAG: hypothetical protein IJL26_12905 [Clostridia bacterium]|nr:hypothetical protein [Clostridia bacterium]